MKQPVIYKIRNVVNGKFYVGSTSDTRERFRRHRNKLRTATHHCPHLQAAWNMYGEDCFKFEVVEEVALEADLWAAENKWLQLHFGTSQCYNAGRSAEAPMRGRIGELHPNHGIPISADRRQQISATLKAYYAANPDKHPRVGTQHTEETRRKISEARTGRGAGADHYRYGKTLSAEVRQKIGDTQRGIPKGPGRVVSAEGREKIAAAAAAGRYSHWAGKTHTEEARAKLRKQVREVTSGAVFGSLTEALQHYGMTMPTLRRALVSSAPIGKGRYKGLQFVYDAG